MNNTEKIIKEIQLRKKTRAKENILYMFIYVLIIISIVYLYSYALSLSIYK